jgi:prefoldin subunit 5
MTQPDIVETDQEVMTEAETAAARREIMAEVWDGAEPAPEPARPAPEPEPEAEYQRQDAEPEDQWAGVPPAIRERFESLQKTSETLADRLKQSERRIGSLTNQLKEAQTAAEETTKDEKDAPSDEEIAAASKSEAEWNELREEFPEWAGAMDNRLAAQSAEFSNSIESLRKQIKDLKSIGNDDLKAEIGNLRNQLAEAVITQKHPNWKTVKDSTDFQNWLNAQPDEVKQKALSSPNAFDAVEVLDLYSGVKPPKKTPAQIAAQRKDRLNQSELPSSSNRRTPAKTEDDMTDLEYRRKLEKEMFDDD